MPRFLSGIQPSGRLHLGNYYGAIREHVRLQDQGEAYYFIADYHALTSLRDAKALRANVFDTAVTYLACGLDPERCVLFRQSDVPEVTELTWMLLTVAPMAMLENAVSYKDKVARGIPADAGLFTYPILMAADILAQDGDVVPVGRDQVQHVEMTRDVAAKFNREYGTDVFKVPEYRLGEAPYVPGTDGAKMSKSYGNVIEIFAEGRELEKSVMGIKTDSSPPAAPKNPDDSTIYKLFSLVAPDEREALAARFRAGGLGYGDAKKLLLARVDAAFAPVRERGKALRADPARVEAILAKGAATARENARRVLARAQGVRPVMSGAPTPGPRELLYSEYINDRAMIEALRLTPRPAGVPEERWPDVAAHAPGAPWPTGGAWCHEEVLFIRTHQAFEVWFALVLHEVESVVAEVAGLWREATGTPPPRVELGERRVEAEAFDPRRAPALAAAVERVAARYGRDRVRKLAELSTPGRLVHAGTLPLDAERASRLDEVLRRGAERMLRAKAALAVTLPFYDVLATMTPAQFLAFRDRLQPASGFGSGQFRELELLLGLRELHADRLRPPPERTPDGDDRTDPELPAPLLRPTAETPAFLAETCFVRTLPPFMWPRVARRFNEPSVRDVVYGLLATTADAAGARHLGVGPVDAAAADRFAARVLEATMDDLHRGLRPGPLDPGTRDRVDTHLRDVDAALSHRETIAAALVEMHGGATPLRAFLDAARQVDGAVLQWRDRHLRFVEGIIGIRRGTGGGGMRYLRGTIDAQRETFLTHALPALWQARTFVHRV